MKSIALIVVVALVALFAVNRLLEDQPLPSGEQVGDAFETAAGAEYNVSRNMRDKMR